MTRFSGTAIFMLSLLSGAALFGSACAESPFPKTSGSVNDFADVMTTPYEKRISNLAEELQAKTGILLFVVTMPDLGGADPVEYAAGLYADRGLGKKEDDKGVLILVAVRERRMRIHTGAGVKGTLSPSDLREIQDRFMAPSLKQSNYDDGLLNGVVALSKIIAKASGVSLDGIRP